MELHKITELEKLKNMEVGSSNYSRHKEFLLWADKAVNLITFDQKLLREFEECIKRADGLFKLGISNEKEIEDAKHAINKAILSFDKIPYPTTNPSPHETNNIHKNWQSSPIKYLAVTVIAAIIAAMILYIFRTHLGISL